MSDSIFIGPVTENVGYEHIATVNYSVSKASSMAQTKFPAKYQCAAIGICTLLFSISLRTQSQDTVSVNLNCKLRLQRWASDGVKL